MNFVFNLLLISSFVLLSARADTPANCTYEDIRGDWIFHESDKDFDSTLNCSASFVPVRDQKISLLFPDVAVDSFGNRGHWTIVYNQGFEVTINYRKYFAFSYYEQAGHNVTSYCGRTQNGWSHNVLGRNWACYVGQKTTPVAPKTEIVNAIAPSDLLFANDDRLIGQINQRQSSWLATRYEQFEGMSHRDLFLMKGGPKSRIASPPKPRVASDEVKQLAATLPSEFDWRNISGVDYVSPVRNQGSCGSCYAFGSLGMMEARLRVKTNNTVQVVLSTQDVVSCSEYSQGCAGGFPYLIAGKYAQDFGVTLDQCNPYQGQDGPCVEKKCHRFYTAKYGYVGGFYGGCNEELMKLELVAGGPLTVAFEVYDDFMQYAGGIYHHTGLTGGFNPFGLTNHAVLVVGYGTDRATNENYWTVKNSWGTGWGEKGYFRIKRGNNECNIESIAVQAEVIP